MLTEFLLSDIYSFGDLIVNFQRQGIRNLKKIRFMEYCLNDILFYVSVGWIVKYMIKIGFEIKPKKIFCNGTFIG